MWGNGRERLRSGFRFDDRCHGGCGRTSRRLLPRFIKLGSTVKLGLVKLGNRYFDLDDLLSVRFVV